MLRSFSLFVLLVAVCSTSLAQYDNQRKELSPAGSREGRWEASVILALQTGNEESFEGGSELVIDSTNGFGINVGWNWTDKLNLAYKLISTKPKYTTLIVPEDTTIVPQLVEHKMTKYSHQLNATYNFTRRAFTPFVVGGIGWTKLDSNVPTGPPSIGCWWDPWWGYICFEDWSTYSTSVFSYNLGLGLRWDINTALFTKASYTREFLSLDNGTLNFDMAIFEFGMMF
jgi:opacity protein-like surface antigen